MTVTYRIPVPSNRGSHSLDMTHDRETIYGSASLHSCNSNLQVAYLRKSSENIECQQRCERFNVPRSCYVGFRAHHAFVWDQDANGLSISRHCRGSFTLMQRSLRRCFDRLHGNARTSVERGSPGVISSLWFLLFDPAST
jgi:hypothetical protein